MDARELRIGNWIHDPIYNKTDFQIEMFLGRDYFQPLCVDPDEELTLQLSECKPIKLTEEWLFKFGFEKAERNYYTKQFNSDKRIMIKMHEERSHVMLRSDDLSLGIYGLDYVHKLQNLYFALTGEELTIKND